MSDPRLRRLIAIDAARIMYEGTEKEYFTAKRKVARRHGVNVRHHPDDLPSNREIRDEILRLAEALEGEGRTERLGRMRWVALEVMRLLEPFRPRLIGSVCTGHIRCGSDVDVHVFADAVVEVSRLLGFARIEHDVEHKRVVKHGVVREFIHVHATLGGYEVELTVYPVAKLGYRFLSSITGEEIESVGIAELEGLLAREHPDELERPLSFEDDVEAEEARRWRRVRFAALLRPLEGIDGGRFHPEGCQLYHSLQVFELARTEAPWDLELAEAAILHDVGKAIDRSDHAALGAEAIDDLVSERVRWLVAHHMDALALRQGKLGRRQAERLRASPWWDDLVSLRDWDDAGRVPGASVPSLDEALDHLTLFADGDERGELW